MHQPHRFADHLTRNRRHWLSATVALSFAITASGPALTQPLSTVSMQELPQGELRPAHPSSISRDGTVVGVSFAADSDIFRWQPGQSPETIGGGPTYALINITPVMDTDGTVVVAPYIDKDTLPGVSIPRAWREGQGWQDLPGLVLATSLPIGISANGNHVVGFGRADASKGHDQPWAWVAASGQIVLDVPAKMHGGEAWAVSDDGTIVGGHVFERSVDDWGWPVTTRFGSRWVDGVVELLADSEGRSVGQAVACNADCSILVGGGAGGNEPPHPYSSYAWYWSKATGAVYLDPSNLPPDAQPPYYAMDITDDGSTIIGAYTIHVETKFGIVVNNQPFIWRAQTGMLSLTEIMASNGIEFGGDGWDMVANSISPDGSMILLNGMDEDYDVRSGVLTIKAETIFADGFEPAAKP